MNNFENYQSPFSWRYGSPGMRYLWSEHNKRLTWRKLWTALAQVQANHGIISWEQAADLRAHQEDVDITRSLEIEAEIHHDVMAEVRAFAEQCPIGGGIIHLGMTSMDVVDNTDALRVRESLVFIKERVEKLLRQLTELILTWAGSPIISYTHLQPAEPTTLGYRFAQYAQDLHHDWRILTRIIVELKGKGLKGAVGTRASYQNLFSGIDLDLIEAEFSAKIDIPFFSVTTQTYPRKQDFYILSNLAGIAATANKFALDLRFLQTPQIGEWMESFSALQVGSSAMPFKRNPIKAEKINSLARWIAQFPRTAWDNAAFMILERTLDDSANRRITLAEALLAVDELLSTWAEILDGLLLDKQIMLRNLESYSAFAAQEVLLMELGKAGADRQEMHERLRLHAIQAWQAIRTGKENPLLDIVLQDVQILKYLNETNVRIIFADVQNRTGDAETLANKLAASIIQDLGLESTPNIQ